MSGYTITLCQSGFALVTVLLLVSLIAVIGITLNRTGGLQMTISSNLKDGEEAYYIANAGIQHAIFWLNHNPGDTGNILSDVPFGTGSYNVSVSNDTSPMGDILISSTGKTGTALKTVEKRVTIGCSGTIYPILVKDTTLDGTKNAFNYGISSHVRFGFVDNKVRGVFKYDLSAIPPGSTIDSAVFELYMYDRQRGELIPVSRDFAIQRLKIAWTEGTKDGATCEVGATWKKYNCDRNWNWTLHLDSVEEAVTNISYNGINQWHQWDIKNLIQYWIDNPSLNDGMLLKDTVEGADASFIGYFYSDEHSDVNFRPKLTVVCN